MIKGSSRRSVGRKIAADEPAAVWVETNKLKPWLKNPRRNDAAVEKVAASIRELGFGAPIVARKANGEIIAGHTRLRAAVSLGLERVPVRYLDVDEVAAKRMALADNRLGELAEWEAEGLAALLSQEDEAMRALLGWGEPDYQRVLMHANVPPPSDFETFDEGIATEHRCPKCGYEWSGQLNGRGKKNA